MMFEERLQKDDYKVVFSSPQGKRVLADLRKRAVLIDNTLNVRNGVDVDKLLVEQGRSDVVRYIYQKMKADPHDARDSHAITERKETQDVRRRN